MEVTVLITLNEQPLEPITLAENLKMGATHGHGKNVPHSFNTENLFTLMSVIFSTHFKIFRNCNRPFKAMHLKLSSKTFDF